MSITNITLKTYDEALVQKLKSIMGVDNEGRPLIDVVYSPVNLVFQKAMKEQKVDDLNQIRLPMVSVYRPSGYSISDQNHRVLGMSEDNFHANYEDSSGELHSRFIKRLYVDVAYQIDIWTQDEYDIALLSQEVLFFLLEKDGLLVNQFMKGIILEGGVESQDVDYVFHLVVDNEVIDNTDLEIESSLGLIYRYTLTVLLEDAVLIRDTRASRVHGIDISHELKRASREIDKEEINICQE